MSTDDFRIRPAGIFLGHLTYRIEMRPLPNGSWFPVSDKKIYLEEAETLLRELRDAAKKGTFTP